MSLTKLLRTGVAALGALAVLSVTQADAADIYSGGGYKDIPAPLPMWNGFYIGGNLGLGWAQLDNDRRGFLVSTPTVLAPAATTAVLLPGNKLTADGGFGGGQIGYNWQSGTCCFVYGFELDLGGIATKEERSFLAFAPGGVFPGVAGRVRVDGGFFGDITGRIGYTWGGSLLYAKGGFAWLNSDVNFAATIITAAGPGATFRSNNDNTTLTGWTVGGGWEYLLNPNWSMKVEYMFYDFGNIDNHCCNDGLNSFNFAHDHDLEVHTVKLGFNYFFRPAPIPLK
jgi:opacity protein-like surface antigen